MRLILGQWQLIQGGVITVGVEHTDKGTVLPYHALTVKGQDIFSGTTVSQDGETAKGATGEEVEGAEEWHEDEQDIEGVKGVIAANAIGQPTTKRRNMRLTI